MSKSKKYHVDVQIQTKVTKPVLKKTLVAIYAIILIIMACKHATIDIIL